MDHEFDFQRLRQMIESRFDLQDLRELCFELDLIYDNLSGDRLSIKIIDLIETMRKTERMSEMMTALQTVRPLLDWPEWRTIEEATAVASPASNPFIYELDSQSNPFGRSGRIEDSTAYLVRQPLTSALVHELQKRVSLSIVGSSQTGKSSLLWHITQQGPHLLDLPPDNFIYLNMELIHSEADFFEYICAELDIEVSRGFRLARKLKGRHIILCLDEIEKMAWEGFSLNVRTELRGLADGTNAPMTLVIASRSPLGQLFPDSPEMTSPLAGLCMQVNMPLFSLAEAQALAVQYCDGLTVQLPATAVEKAWQESAGHPRQLQLALSQLFAQLIQEVEEND